ncbi:hypothetical protein MATL_G00076770 [Megalops atlanticus]|uniref:Uncharacterized protein n=1 Tax=Megalops atlanticus TaxID=7932 RepID=A0A9D3Q693_MEGAT|nr:hypothetical protein MATL_G00076770 [Megalops atlanticus]
MGRCLLQISSRESETEGRRLLFPQEDYGSCTWNEQSSVAKGLGDGNILGRSGINMWCLHCTSEKTQSLLELELDSW